MEINDLAVASAAGVSVNAVKKIKSAGYSIQMKHADDITLKLIELEKNEPTSDNEFCRLAIVDYEMRDLARAIVYAHRFRNSNKVLFRDGFKDNSTIMSEGKLAMADLCYYL